MNENDLQRVYNCPIYPRDSKRYSDKVIVNTDNGSHGGSHCCAFFVEKSKSYYFDRFGGAPDKFPLKQLPKPTTYHNYKTQYLNSKFCGSYCFFSI